MNPRKVAADFLKDAAKKDDDGWPKKLEKGRFTTYCKTQGFDGPCQGCVEKALKSDDPGVRGMATWYTNTVLKKKEK
jgi:hypothetical protein